MTLELSIKCQGFTYTAMGFHRVNCANIEFEIGPCSSLLIWLNLSRKMSRGKDTAMEGARGEHFFSQRCRFIFFV